MEYEVSIQPKEVTSIVENSATAELKILIESIVIIPDHLWDIAKHVTSTILNSLSSETDSRQLSILTDHVIPDGRESLYQRHLNGALQNIGGAQVPVPTLFQIGDIKRVLTGKLAPKPPTERPDDGGVYFQGVMNGFVREGSYIIVGQEKGAPIKLIYEPNRDYLRILSEMSRPLGSRILIKGIYLRTTDLRNVEHKVLKKWEVFDDTRYDLT